MGPIQSSINQSLAILSMAASQDPTWREVREGRTDINIGGRQSDIAGALEDNAREAFTELTNMGAEPKHVSDAANLMQKYTKERIAATEKQREGFSKLGDLQAVDLLDQGLNISRETYADFDKTLMAYKNAHGLLRGKEGQVIRMEEMKKALKKEDI